MYAVVRIRGIPDKNGKVSTILDQMGLVTRNKVALVPETDNFEGMINKIKDVVTFGTVSEGFLESFLEERLELEDALDELGLKSVDELVESVDNNEITLSELKEAGFENVFSLNSPSKGFKNTKRQFNQGGSLGSRETFEIEHLIKRM